jgi:excisionase family DNA binding protein
MNTTAPGAEKLLTVAEAAHRLGTWETGGERFPRRLIAQRRIRFVRIGRLVRIPESAIAEYIEAQTVPPITSRRSVRAVA